MVTKEHIPVLVKEVLKVFEIDLNAHLHFQAKVIDATLGSGGHSSELLKRGVEVLGIDDDPSMLEIAKKKLSLACPVPTTSRDLPFKLHIGNFRDIKSIAEEENFIPNFILADLGLNSVQQLSDDRGFSFQYRDALLDMRLNKEKQSVKGSDLLNALPKPALVNIFEESMGYVESRKLADAIIKFRSQKSISTVGDFSDIINTSSRFVRQNMKTHKETIPFMALRIAVNSEFDNLKTFLKDSLTLLPKGGRLAVITFHSGEDRIVKDFFTNTKELNQVNILTPKPIVPENDEVSANPKSRSAKLRGVIKI